MPKDISIELRTALYGRSSVFIGPAEAPIERIVYHMMHETARSGKTVIWICLRDTPSIIFSKFSSYELPMDGLKDKIWFVDATITGDRTMTMQTSRCSPLDYACMIMEVGKLLKIHPISLVLLDNISILVAFDRVDLIVRPLKYLDAKIRAEGGGFVTMLPNKAIPGRAEAELLGLIDIIIRVEKDNIHAHAGSKELSIPFCFTGSEFILGGADADKDLQELFSLTTEEKKKLEREVDEKAHLYE